jgi:SHS2 domain-containing protein
LKKYSTFNHTADIGIKVSGESIADLFANAALAIADIITDVNCIRDKETRAITVSGLDGNDLWVNFLREVLYTFNGAGFFIKDCKVIEIDNNHATAQLTGEPFDPEIHTIKKEIKGVTYHQASVKQDLHKWRGRVILDV